MQVFCKITSNVDEKISRLSGAYRDNCRSTAIWPRAAVRKIMNGIELTSESIRQNYNEILRPETTKHYSIKDVRAKLQKKLHFNRICEAI